MAAKDNDDRKPDDQDAEVSLDMSQAAVKKMISEARERGYITYDQLNTVLPPDQVSSEQIEDVMSMLSEMGINVIEDEDAEEEDAKGSTELATTDSAKAIAGAPIIEAQSQQMRFASAGVDGNPVRFCHPLSIGHEIQGE